jgi:hypothetical protein
VGDYLDPGTRQLLARADALCERSRFIWELANAISGRVKPLLRHLLAAGLIWMVCFVKRPGLRVALRGKSKALPQADGPVPCYCTLSKSMSKTSVEFAGMPGCAAAP